MSEFRITDAIIIALLFCVGVHLALVHKAIEKKLEEANTCGVIVSGEDEP